MAIFKYLQRIDRGSLAGWVQQLCTASSALLLLPIFIRYLGDSKSGLWLAFQSVVAVAGLADFGVSYIISRQVAYALGRENGSGFSGAKDIDDGLVGVSGLREALRLSRLANAVSCLLGILVLVSGMRFVHFEVGSGMESLNSGWIIGLLGATVLVRLWGRPVVSILDGAGLIYYGRLIGGGQQLLMSAGAVVIVIFGGDLISVSAWAVVTVIVEYCLLRSKYIQNFGEIPAVKPIKGDASRLIKLLKTSYPLGLVNVGGYLVNSVQLPFIAAALGPTAVTPYYIAQRMGQFINIAILQLVLPKLPQFTKLLGMGNCSAAVALMKKTATQVFVFSFFGSISFFFLVPFISSFYFKVQPLPMSVILAIAIDLFLLNSAVTMGHYVLASGRNPFWVWTLICGALNFTLIYFALDSWGLVAIPVAGIIAGLCTTYWSTFYYGIRLWKNLKKTSSCV